MATKAPKSAPSPDAVSSDAQNDIMIAELLREAGVPPEKAVELVNNKAQYGSIDEFVAAAGLTPVSRSVNVQAFDPKAMPNKYKGFPNVINAWNWYIAHGYDENMTEIWLDDRINRGGLMKDSRTLITSYNPRALLKVGAARLAESN